MSRACWVVLRSWTFNDDDDDAEPCTMYNLVQGTILYNVQPCTMLYTIQFLTSNEALYIYLLNGCRKEYYGKCPDVFYWFWEQLHSRVLSCFSVRSAQTDMVICSHYKGLKIPLQIARPKRAALSRDAREDCWYNLAHEPDLVTPLWVNLLLPKLPLDFTVEYFGFRVITSVV